MRAARSVLAGAAFAALLPATSAPAATRGLPMSNGQGPIRALTSGRITVKDPTAPAVSCSLGLRSPSVAGYRPGVWAVVDCREGVLTLITRRGTEPGDGETLPGLSRFMAGLPVAGAVPTLNECASSWNADAPSAAQRALAVRAALGAVLRASTTTVADRTPEAAGPECWIEVALPGQQSALIRGYWQDGTVRNWSGIVTKEFVSTSRAQFAVTGSGALRVR